MDELVKLVIALVGQGMGQVIITPLPPEWLPDTPPPAPPEQDDPGDTEYTCPGGFPGDDCTG